MNVEGYIELVEGKYVNSGSACEGTELSYEFPFRQYVSLHSRYGATCQYISISSHESIWYAVDYGYARPDCNRS